MSIEYEAKIIVGLPAQELADDHEDFYETIEPLDDDMRIVSPYFDAGFEHCLIGLKVAATSCYSYETINMIEVNKLIYNAKNAFRELFGKEPEVYLSLNSY